MIAQQIRAWEVLDESVLSLYEGLWREDFVSDSSLRDLAYADMALPIGDGQVMLEPKLEARMLQVLLAQADENLLHIGCGSGYFAALLGKMAATVHSLDNRPDLAAAAQSRLQALKDIHVSVEVADGMDGWPDAAPYDAIVLTGSLPQVPATLFQQLAAGGRLLAIVGTAPIMRLRLHEKKPTGDILHRDILETVVPSLDNVRRERAFFL